MADMLLPPADGPANSPADEEWRVGLRAALGKELRSADFWLHEWTAMGLIAFSTALLSTVVFGVAWYTVIGIPFLGLVILCVTLALQSQELERKRLVKVVLEGLKKPDGLPTTSGMGQ